MANPGYPLHVHLIAIEVGVVGRCHGEIEAESLHSVVSRSIYLYQAVILRNMTSA
jgi:hypothetical protein